MKSRRSGRTTLQPLGHRLRGGACSLLAAIVPLGSAWGDPPVGTAVGPPPAGAKAVGIDDAVGQLPPAIKPPARWALVIGVGDYADTRIPDLPACEKDARDLAATLLDPEAGLFPKDHVTLLVSGEVNRTSVVAALDQLARKAGPDDLVVVFFSGHGATDEKGRAYWVMSDTKADQLRATALPELEITELLGEIKTRRLVTIIDACYSAATANLAATKALIDLGKIYPEFQGDGRVGITASKGDQLSMVITDEKDPGFGHSAFAYHVIDGLRGKADTSGNNDGIVELDELWGYVKDRTIATARRQGGNQEPQLKGQVGSRFLLAVDAERLTSLAESRRGEVAKAKTQLETLKKLFAEDAITAAQLEEAKQLLGRPDDGLGAAERARRDAYADVAEGRLPPRHLASVLGAAGGATPAPAAAPAPALSPMASAAWPEQLAGLASRFEEEGAPVLFLVDPKVAASPALGRFVQGALSWPAASPATKGTTTGSDAANPNAVALVLDPYPARADTTLLIRGGLRRYPSDAAPRLVAAPPSGSKVVGDPGRERLVGGGATTAFVGPRCSLTLLGDAQQVDALLDRSAGERLAWSKAIENVAAAKSAFGLVADAAWFRTVLARLETSHPGQMFEARVFVELRLGTQSDFDEWDRLWRLSTDGIMAASATAELRTEGSTEWLRCSFRLEFAGTGAAAGAIETWSDFQRRLPERFGADNLRLLDIQRGDATIVLRFDLKASALADWLDAHLAFPGSHALQP